VAGADLTRQGFAFRREQTWLFSVSSPVKMLCLILALLAGNAAAGTNGIVRPLTVTNDPTVRSLKLSPLAPKLVLTNYTPSVSGPRFPPPGVYETAPYSCIVIVPGLPADYRFLRPPAYAGPPMPAVQPELRFIPRAPRKNP
jgi:hypothetical protein